MAPTEDARSISVAEDERPRSSTRGNATGELVLRAASREGSRPGSRQSHFSIASTRPKQGGSLLRGNSNLGTTLPKDSTNLLPRLAAAGQRPDSRELIHLFRMEPLQLGEVEAILRTRPAIVNRKEDTFGWPPLLFAAHKGNVALIKKMLDAKADHKATCAMGNTALQLAARGGHKGAVQYLISAKAEVDKQNINGWTALTWSASGGHGELVEVLLAAHAQVDRTDEQGRNACMWAARNGHAESVHIMAAAGLDFLLQDDDGLMVSDHAQNFHQLRLAILEYARTNQRLIDAVKVGDVSAASQALKEGAVVNARSTEDGGDALSLAISLTGKSEQDDMLKLLMQHGANLLDGEGAIAEQAENLQDVLENALGTRKVFINSAFQGNWEDVRSALEAGAYVDVADALERTAFIWAAIHGAREPLVWLMEAGADIERRDSYGWTAVHYAVQASELESVSTLHHLGASFTAHTYDGETTQHLAASADGGQTLQLLSAAGADLNAVDADNLVPAQVAAIRGCNNALHALLVLKADPKVKDHHDRSLFALAVAHGHVSTVQLLVGQLWTLPWEECAGFVSTRKPQGKTHKKHAKGLAKKATKSLDQSAKLRHSSPSCEVEEKTQKVAGKVRKRPMVHRSRSRMSANGQTWASLVEAAFAASEALPSKFPAPLALQDALTGRDKEGRSALALSVVCGQPHVQAVLLELRASPDAQDAEGNTALMLGATHGSQLAINLLLDAANGSARNRAGKRALELANRSDLRRLLKADLDRKLVIQHLAKSESLPAIMGSHGGPRATSPELRPQLPEGQLMRRFRFEGLKGDAFDLEASIRELFPKGCGAKILRVHVAVDPLTQACRGFAHVDLSLTHKKQPLRLDSDEVESLLGSRVRVVEEFRADWWKSAPPAV